MTERQRIVGEITRLEGVIESSTKELDALKSRLRDELPDLLDRDQEAETKALIGRMNDFLRQEGLLPPK